MNFTKLAKPMLMGLLACLCSLLVQAQTKTITGKVTDSKDGSPMAGVSIVVKGSSTGTQTGSDGTFKLNVSAAAKTLVISSVGYVSEEVNIQSKSAITVSLKATSDQLNEVVVIGYGTARKRDLTGSVGSVQAKDFNKGVAAAPDQLLQGKVAGLQITNSNGQPGGETVVQIRGNNSIRTGNTPLYVVDGIPLDGRSARPGVLNNSGVGTTPGGNPLTYINPSDIASVDVLKDASAAAIYGSRGANGVILITTRKGQVGPTRVEVAASTGFSDIMRKTKVLDAGGYRAALKTYNAPLSDSGATVDPFKAITRNALSQNYSVAFGGGTENGRYRASFLVSDQQGLIRKSGLKKYVGNFGGSYKFLDNKLSLDFNAAIANVSENIAPISNDAGSGGNLISLALIWNPTLNLVRSNGLYNQANPSGQVNPLAFSDAYNDKTSINTVLASASLGYKITPDLEYRVLYGVNYSAGLRKQELQGWIKGTGGVADGAGIANVGNTQLASQTLTHTLNYVKKLTSDLNLNAVAGYEYWTTTYQGNQSAVYGFNYNLQQQNVTNVHYYDNMEDGKQGNLSTTSFKDPTVELQSYFARVALNYQDKYLLTGTFRADGSSKFGTNNKYAYFPSIAAAWNVANEQFMKGNKIFNSLKFRVGWGQTGNQEFNPVDAAFDVYHYTSNGSLKTIHFGNPNLKWETVTSTDAGVDFSILGGRVFGSVDYFNKKTTNPLYGFTIAQPTAGSGTVYKNMDGNGTPNSWITNKGVEIMVGAALVRKTNFTWNANVNVTLVKNKFSSPSLSSVPFLTNTGALHGQGTSGAYAQVIADGQPIDVYYLPTFQGFGSNGIAKYSATPVFSGDPNPTTYIGFGTDLNYKKWSLVINMHGSYGNLLYNNTTMSVLNISNIIGGRNITSKLIGNGESVANAITPSTRYLESGDYMKLGNATISYRIGNLGKTIKNLNAYVTGSNLFTITKYSGFDPEVNVNKALNGIPSLGIDYIGFPTARTFIFGINFSL